MAEELIPFTKDGYQTLQDELYRLKHTERPKIIQDIADARAHGDLSENAEYHAARERQGFVEARIGELEGNLGRANIIDFTSESNASTQVRFGAYVTEADKIGAALEEGLRQVRQGSPAVVAVRVIGPTLDR